jgi:Lar family restriction alleviation protein
MELNMEITDLKPCPFCGGKAELIKRRQCLADAYSVRCKNSGCRGRTQKLVRTEQQAIEEWNRRAGNEQSNETGM